jgi:cation transport protein ChaC
MDVLLERWVFGYGSLIWDPEVDYDHAELGRLHGFHRRFCIGSTRYRGTPENPGVVLGLDRGGSCIGVAYRLREQTLRESIDKLYARELGNPLNAKPVYVPTRVSVNLAGGRRIEALTFVANRECEAYQRLCDTEVMQRLKGCCGQRGPNADYLLNTVTSLEAHGVRDSMLRRLARQLTGTPPPAAA